MSFEKYFRFVLLLILVFSSLAIASSNVNSHSETAITIANPLIPSSTDSYGGPDVLGYRWRDNNSDAYGPAYNWYDISSTGTAITFASGNDAIATIPIGFSFTYDGYAKTRVGVAIDGYLSFTDTTSDVPSNVAIPTSTSPNYMFAPFWADLYIGTTAPLGVKYRNVGTDTLVISWTTVKNTARTDTLRFQAILVRSGDILFQYNTVTNPASVIPSIGIENHSGQIGLQVAYNTAYATAGRVVRFTTRVLSGTKTVGRTTSDYPTIAAALTALYTDGVSQNGVTFDFEGGPFTTPFTVNPFPGMGTSNPVIFRGHNSVTLNPPVGSYAITLAGVQYVTIQDFIITDNSTGSGVARGGICITNSSVTTGSQNNTIKNCAITMRVSSTTDTSCGVIVKNSYAPSGSNGANSYNNFLNLKISKCNYGVYEQGSAYYLNVNNEYGSDSTGTGYSKRFTIGAAINDTIGGYTGYNGIYIQYANGVSIHDLDVCQVYGTGTELNVAGIYLTGLMSTSAIYNCRVHDINLAAATTRSCYGMLLSSAGTVNCYNNMIYGLYGMPATSSYYLRGFHTTNRVNFYNNSIVIDTLKPNISRSVSGSYCFSSYYGDVNMYNNILNNTQRNSILISVSSGTFNSDYNAFNFPSDNHFFINAYTDWAGWLAPNRDRHSVLGVPSFAGYTYPPDFHIQLNQSSSIVEGAGLHEALVTTDIDGEIRDTLSPDIGADEGSFAPILSTMNYPASISFNDTRTAHFDSVLVSIRQSQNRAFTFSNIQTSNNSVFSYRVVNSGSTINVRDTLQIWVRFKPDTTITYTDTLRVTISSPYNSVALPLNGRGNGYYVSMPASSMCFPNPLSPGQFASLELPVIVRGNSALDSAHWITLPSNAPFYVLPGTMSSLPVGNIVPSRLYFAPTTSGSFSAQVGLVSNAANGDTILMNVSGVAQSAVVTPGLGIAINEYNTVLNWSRPDTLVQYYLVYFRNSATIPWQYLTSTTGAYSTTFTHVNVVRFSPQMYYQVTAWYGNSSDDSFDRIIRTIPVGTPESEVIRILMGTH